MGAAPIDEARRAALAIACFAPAMLAAGRAAAATAPEAPSPANTRLGFTPVPVPRQHPATNGTLTLPGASIGYWDTGGRGDPVILLHPATGNMQSFVYQQPVLAAAGYRVIGYARRGFDGSPAGDPTINPPADQDLAALIDHLGLNKVHLVGCSAGGMLAAEYATAHPDRIASMTFAGSIINSREPVMAAAQAVLIPKQFYSLPADFRELGPSYRAGDPEGLARWIAIDAMPKVGTMTRVATSGNVRFDALARIAPTLLLTGDCDLYCPPSVLANVHARMPGATMAVVDDCGHACFWEQPVAFNRLLTGFLARHRAGGTRKGRG